MNLSSIVLVFSKTLFILHNTQTQPPYSKHFQVKMLGAELNSFLIRLQITGKKLFEPSHNCNISIVNESFQNPGFSCFYTLCLLVQPEIMNTRLITDCKNSLTNVQQSHVSLHFINVYSKLAFLFPFLTTIHYISEGGDLDKDNTVR